MSDIGKLCYKKGGSALAYKKGGSALIFKTSQLNDIDIMIVSDQYEVGPIKSCGHVHQVIIDASGSFSQGSGTVTIGTSSAGNISAKIHITSKPATITFNCTSISQGCAYPDENPPMGFAISATQNGGDTKNTNKSVSNVARGSFSFTVYVGSDGKISGVN